MSDVWFDLNTEAVCILGGGGALVGLTGLVERPNRHRFLNMTNAVGLLLMAAATAAAFAASTTETPWVQGWEWAFVVGLLPWLVSLACWGQRLLNWPRLQGALLLLTSPLVAVAWAADSDGLYHIPGVRRPPVQRFEPQPPLQPTTFYAGTDRDGAIPLWSFSASPSLMPQTQMEEQKLGRTLPLKVIRTAPPDFNSNCHGWVFTDGRFCIHDDDVPTILRDNGYQIVETPRSGDLIAYTHGPDEIVHTGVVRVVEPGMILVESKWGRMGRYLHAPADQTFSPMWTFYRTQRGSHQLPIQASQFAE